MKKATLFILMLFAWTFSTDSSDSDGSAVGYKSESNYGWQRGNGI